MKLKIQTIQFLQKITAYFPHMQALWNSVKGVSKITTNLPNP